MSNVDQRVIYRANKKKSRGIIPRSKFLNLAKKKKKKRKVRVPENTQRRTRINYHT